MPPAELLNLIRQKPFLPFRINLTDGRVFEVRHPEFVMVSRHIAIIGFPASDDTGLISNHITVALVHVVRLEPIPAGPPKGTKEGP
jgi:hypothetical protein